MFRGLAGVAIAVAVVGFTADARADVITGLYSTGVDNSGVATNTDAADLHWTLNGGPAYTGAVSGQWPIGVWMQNTSASQWITPSTNAAQSYDTGASNGYYTYTLSFDLLSGQDPLSASFTGQFAVDDRVTSIMLNGTTLFSGSEGSDSAWTDFSASSGFLSGQNTLTFTVENIGGVSSNPTGLDVDFLSSYVAAVPEPATWLMMILGFVGLGSLGYRRQKSKIAAI